MRLPFSAQDVTDLLGKAGIEVEQERLDHLIKELEGKDLAELLALGKEKLFVGGGAPAVGGGGGSGGDAAAAAEAAPAAPKVEEVDALEGGMDMFGGGGGGGDY